MSRYPIRYVALGLLRMGWVSNFLSKAVLAGFILGILFLGIIQGILIGVVLSLLALIARASKPGIRRLGRGITLTLARVEPSILELWTRAGAIDALCPGRVFGTVRGAVNAVTATSAGVTS